MDGWIYSHPSQFLAFWVAVFSATLALCIIITLSPNAALWAGYFQVCKGA